MALFLTLKVTGNWQDILLKQPKTIRCGGDPWQSLWGEIDSILSARHYSWSAPLALWLHMLSIYFPLESGLVQCTEYIFHWQTLWAARGKLYHTHTHIHAHKRLCGYMQEWVMVCVPQYTILQVSLHILNSDASWKIKPVCQFVIQSLALKVTNKCLPITEEVEDIRENL